MWEAGIKAEGHRVNLEFSVRFEFGLCTVPGQESSYV